MLNEQDKRAIRSRLRAIERAEDRLKEKRKDLAVLLESLARVKGATLAELGGVVGVSRQRIHQILTKE